MYQLLQPATANSWQEHRHEVHGAPLREGVPLALLVPVKPFIWPARAFLYKPLGSRSSQMLMGTWRQQVTMYQHLANQLSFVDAQEARILPSITARTGRQCIQQLQGDKECIAYSGQGTCLRARIYEIRTLNAGEAH